MIRIIRRWLLCSRGRHLPDRRRARYISGVPTARCEICGSEMKKHAARGWVLSADF